MRLISTLSLAGCLLALAALPACSGSGSASVTGGQGHLEVRLTDAPLDLAGAKSVIVTIDGVLVYPGVSEMDGTETAPITILTHPATFDLLTLTGGATTLLASGELPAGFYQRIRLNISSATLTFKDGTTTPLKIDSNKVDIPIRFEVKIDNAAVVTLDFQADASVQVNEAAPDKYILRPVVTPVSH